MGVAAALVVLLLSWDADADVVVFSDGTRLTVQSYELKGDLVVITTLDGKIQSVARRFVDLEATERLNSNGQPQPGQPVSDAAPRAPAPAGGRIQNPKYAIQNYFSTSSALISTPGGIVTPIFLAVLRLIMNSNFGGGSTGKVAGFAPFRILST